MTRRAIIWTLNFTLKGYFFGPTISANTGIIKEINTNISIPPGNVLMENATQNSSPAQVNLDIFPAQYANGQPAYSNNAIFEYRINNLSGQFITTEKVAVNDDNFMYLKEGNTTHLKTSGVYGEISNNQLIYGEQSGAAATITRINRIPTYNLVNTNIIASNSNYGFIINLYENY
jgi:hypothetical protein